MFHFVNETKQRRPHSLHRLGADKQRSEKGGGHVTWADSQLEERWSRDIEQADFIYLFIVSTVVLCVSVNFIVAGIQGTVTVTV